MDVENLFGPLLTDETLNKSNNLFVWTTRNKQFDTFSSHRARQERECLIDCYVIPIDPAWSGFYIV